MKEYTLGDILALTKNRKPDFGNLAAVLQGKKPQRPTLFELFLNRPLERLLAGWDGEPGTEQELLRCKIKAFANAGYDYATVHASGFRFKRIDNHHPGKASISANEGFVIYDWESFEKYNWEDPRSYYTGRMEALAPELPGGMKLVVMGPGGVLENVINLVGFNNLCYLIADDPALVEAVASHVGQRLLEYYSQIVSCDCVGAIVSNDDWGFNTQTMLSPPDMRKYIFKWHKRIVQAAHAAGKPAILHSCGNLDDVWDDIINDMGFDAKHSYEDKIRPVEQAYDMLAGRIAVLGGIDVDYVCSAPAGDVFARGRRMVEKTGCKGYALGTGNSIPAYLPNERYYTLLASLLAM